ncbi:MAG TPA: ACP S-malonyltransferase [Actinomycetota bacterium]|nr:ACP S-malonyltransferase [Actinomycetota bacterium]
MIVGLFPGQGIPARDVLAALRDAEDEARTARDVFGYDLAARVEVAARRAGAPLPTKVAQPAIFVASVVAWRRSLDSGERFDMLAGHSLGEYAALVAGSALRFEDGLFVVARRAEAMERARRATPGGMTAILGLDLEITADLARRAGCVVANDNAPGQVVLSGPEPALAEASARARERGGRAVLLDVSGPFHSGAMSAVREDLRDALERVDLRSPSIPVVSNVSARPYRSPGEIRRLLIDQVVDRVRFRESLEWMWREGVRSFRDLGPGAVVAGLAARTFRHLDRQGSAARV